MPLFLAPARYHRQGKELSAPRRQSPSADAWPWTAGALRVPHALQSELLELGGPRRNERSPTQTSRASSLLEAHCALALALLRFVHLDGAAVDHGAVHLAHCPPCVVPTDKRYEAKAAGTACLPICDDLDVIQLAKLFKCPTEAALVGVPAQAADE